MADNQYVNKVIFGDEVLLDLTDDTVDSAHLFKGYIAHDKSGQIIEGNYEEPSINLDIVTPPEKTSYVVGESLDLTGISVNGVIDDEFVKDVTSECTYNPVNGSILDKDDQSVEITCTILGSEIKTVQNIDVIYIDHIYVSALPTKTVYDSGERLDLTGVEIKAVWSNDTENDITSQCIFNPAQDELLLTGGDQTVSVSYTDGDTVLTTSFIVTVIVLEIVSWADGTDEQIKRMIDAHYAGKLNLHDYWNVGDVRKVDLASVPGVIDSEKHYAKTNKNLVLMHAGGKELTTPINGITECAFVVGFDAYLGWYEERGRMNPTGTNVGGWDQCERRTWCNEVFPDSFSSSIRSIFKQHKNITGKGGAVDEIVVSNDYFALPAGKEIWGNSSTLTQSSENAALVQFTYFADGTNRRKYNSCWTRSPIYWTSGHFTNTDSNGNGGYEAANSGNGIAPFGVI